MNDSKEEQILQEIIEKLEELEAIGRKTVEEEQALLKEVKTVVKGLELEEARKKLEELKQ